MSRSNYIPHGDDKYIAGDTAVLVDTVPKVTAPRGDDVDVEIAFTLSEYPAASPIIEKVTPHPDITITDPVNGTFRITVNGEETRDLGTPRGKRYHYEIEVGNQSKERGTAASGWWTIYANTVTVLE